VFIHFSVIDNFLKKEIFLPPETPPHPIAMFTPRKQLQPAHTDDEAWTQEYVGCVPSPVPRSSAAALVMACNMWR
jgi:hypothetical protein